MNKIDDRTARNNYALYSLGASRAEQRSDYAEATQLWGKAMRSPCNAHALFWAEKRAAFCANAVKMHWRHPNDRHAV